MFLGLKNILDIVLLDLDGTLLNNDKKIGKLDYQALIDLGKLDIQRVIATGRSLNSALKVLPENCPVDYLVFSSGAGVLEWKNQKIIFQSSISKKNVNVVERMLRQMCLNFSIQFPIPENHHYFYFKGNYSETDFDHRNSLYSSVCNELTDTYPLDTASQFLIFLSNENDIHPITSRINGLKAIRATSPIDGKSIWLEIFNKNVSKALGAKFICDLLNISQKKTLSIGNDYNDIELLEWTTYSFLVSNATEAIKDKYQQCTDNQNNPLYNVIQLLYKK